MFYLDSAFYVIKLENDLKICHFFPKSQNVIATAKEHRLSALLAQVNISTHSCWSAWFQVTVIDGYAFLKSLNFERRSNKYVETILIFKDLAGYCQCNAYSSFKSMLRSNIPRQLEESLSEGESRSLSDDFVFNIV